MAKRTIVTAENAPKAIGPYSHAVRAGCLLFTSGQLGLDPATGELLKGGVAEETRQALRNLSAVLDAAGAGLVDVVKTTVFLRDMGDFAAMNSVYGEFFFSAPPARSTVQVARLPKDAAVEVECVASMREDS